MKDIKITPAILTITLKVTGLNVSIKKEIVKVYHQTIFTYMLPP